MSVPFEKPWGNYLLDKIIEVGAPDSISWLPETWGWLLVASYLLFRLARYGYRQYRRYQHNIYRRQATLWLAENDAFLTTSDNSMVNQLPALIRKVASVPFERKNISHLSGKEWDTFLDAQCPNSQFASKCPELLSQIAYQPNKPVNEEALATLKQQIQHWIANHRGLYD